MDKVVYIKKTERFTEVNLKIIFKMVMGYIIEPMVIDMKEIDSMLKGMTKAFSTVKMLVMNKNEIWVVKSKN